MAKKEVEFYPMTDKEQEHSNGVRASFIKGFEKLSKEDQARIETLISAISLVKHRKWQDAEKTLNHLLAFMMEDVNK